VKTVRDPLTVPEGIAGATTEYLARILRPAAWPHRPARDASSLVILDDSGSQPRILMGRRASGHAFLPGVLVFPGGRVEPRDYRLKTRRDFPPALVEKLAAHSKTRHPAAFARALASAALREAREEVGFVGPGSGPGEEVDLRRISFIARALTPAKRPRRFDTRFFCLRCEEPVQALHPGDGELEDINWYALDALANSELHVVSRVVIETLIHRLNQGRLLDGRESVPFLFARGSRFQRILV